MTAAPDAGTPALLCLGAALWDVIGRAPGAMRPGEDIPGRIERIPGGVALNIALAAARQGLRVGMLTAIGQDPEGEALALACAAQGVAMDLAHRHPELPTDCYMAIEAGGEVLGAIADARLLEAAGTAILAPLHDGRLGTAGSPWSGRLVIDGNPTEETLAAIAADPALARSELRLVPASPGKALRMRVFLGHPSAVFHVNLVEAGLICGRPFAASPEAALALRAAGAARAVVTHGGQAAADAGEHGLVTRMPPPVAVARVTGAGDAFVAGHIAAEAAGADADAAIAAALNAAALHVAGHPPAPLPDRERKAP